MRIAVTLIRIIQNLYIRGTMPVTLSPRCQLPGLPTLLESSSQVVFQATSTLTGLCNNVDLFCNIALISLTLFKGPCAPLGLEDKVQPGRK